MSQMADLQNKLILDGNPVSLEKTDAMDFTTLVFNALPIILIIMAGMWFLLVSLRDESGGVL
jgi:hypothetical protein